jgi:carbon storage regulator
MLVLSRQRDETIMIGDDIEITIVDIRGDKVRLGITAPSQIAVHRKEVYDAIKAENQRAAQAADSDLSEFNKGVSPGPPKRKTGDADGAHPTLRARVVQPRNEPDATGRRLA